MSVILETKEEGKTITQTRLRDDGKFEKRSNHVVLNTNAMITSFGGTQIQWGHTRATIEMIEVID